MLIEDSDKNIVFMPDMPKFLPPQYVLLLNTSACQALWWYYVNAKRTYDNNIATSHQVYEDEKDHSYNFKLLYYSTMRLYGADPEIATSYWPVIDAQAIKLGLPLLMDNPVYRHNGRIILQ